eukprot:5554585-Lingulodinium_polyedra.AAC.1
MWMHMLTTNGNVACPDCVERLRLHGARQHANARACKMGNPDQPRNPLTRPTYSGIGTHLHMHIPNTHTTMLQRDETHCTT